MSHDSATPTGEQPTDQLATRRRRPGANPARSGGDFDYETHGHGYAVIRQPDPRIAAHVEAALGGARSVINVGAGTGSYEPTGRYVAAIEPSATMRAQRPCTLAPAIDATAEALPFDDDSFDAAMAMITVHQWPDVEAGLREMRRVSRGPVVILTFDRDALEQFWIVDHAPELIAREQRRFPTIARITDTLGGASTVASVPVPADCTDGFVEAFYARPERLLDPDVRRAQSAWEFIGADVEQRAVQALRADLADGSWDRRHGHLRDLAYTDASLRLITAAPANDPGPQT